MIITRAAIMYPNGEFVEGHSYGDILKLSNKLNFYGEKIYGFVTSYGEFVLPKDAAQIALEAGQIPILKEELTPEDLWPEWSSGN